MSPLESESRMAAQFAPLATVESIPYFLKIPFSCAITIGEQSVSAIMPNFIFAVSGASLAKTEPVQRAGKPARSEAAAERVRNFRRVSLGPVSAFILLHSEAYVRSLAESLATGMPCGPPPAYRCFDCSHESDSSMSVPLDSRQLRAFSALARTGSFTLAAKELYLSQSAVSHSMKALEEDVGCRLLDRVGKKVFLTQAGEQLLNHTEKILREMKNARESLQQLGKWGKGRVRLGASTTACQYIIPNALTEFKKKFADCAVTIEPGDTSEMVEALYANRIDIAIALRPQNDDGLDFRPLFTDELSFLVSPLHSWATNRHAPRDDVSKQNFILYNRSSYTARVIDDYFRQERIVLNTCIELGSMEAMKELVKLNLSVSIVAPWIVREEIAAGTLVALSMGRRKLKREWGIIHLQERRLGLPEETFIKIAQEAVNNAKINT